MAAFTETIATNSRQVSNRAPDPREDAAPEHSRVSPCIYLQGEHLCGPGAVLEWISHGHGQEAKMSKSSRGTEIHYSAVWSDQIYARQERDTSRSQDG